MNNFLTRQAIFDKNLKVIAYKLRMSSSLHKENNSGLSADQLTSKLITDSFFLKGIEAISNDSEVYIHFTKKLLFLDFTNFLPSERIIVEIAADLSLDEKVINICKNLHEKGYTIAIDNVMIDNFSTSILPFVKIAKIDYNKNGDYLKKAILKKLMPHNIKCLVKNVNKQDEYEKSFNMGFEYFQGSFFCKPKIIENKQIAIRQHNYFELLKEISKTDFDFTRIENIIKQDVALTFKLLKMINSAGFGLKNKIKSINQALTLLGTVEVKRWMTLVILSALGSENPDELMRTALIRAKLLETIAPAIEQTQKSSDFFMIGMFSLMDAILGQPLDAILSGLPLSKDINNALLGKESPYEKPYQLALCYEKADWEKTHELATEMKIEETKLPDLYTKAVEWVNKISLN